MTCNIGFRIYTKIARPDRSLVEKFKDMPAANIADEMKRISCMHSRIKAVSAVPLLGTALTVKVRSGDILMIHKALDMAGPDVVVDGQGDTTNALAGELMMRQAARAGLGGVVVIAPDQAEELAKRARNKSQKDQITLREIDAGTRDRSAYSDDAFRKRGCEIVDDFYKR